MAGGGKKTVDLATAIFNAAKHAWGALKGFYDAFRSVWDTFKKVYDTISTVYNKVIGWVKDQLGPIWDAYETLRDIYKDHIKPVLDWVSDTLDKLEAAYLAFKGEIIEALYRLDQKTFGWIKELWGKVDRILTRASNLAEAFSSRLAKRIRSFRDDLRDAIIGTINRIEGHVFDALEWVEKEIFDRVEIIFEWSRKFTKFEIDTVTRILKDLDESMYPDGKPKLKHQLKVSKYWGDLMIQHTALKDQKPVRPSAEQLKSMITARPPGTRYELLHEFYKDTSIPLGTRGALWAISEFEKPDWGRFRTSLDYVQNYIPEWIMREVGLERVDASDRLRRARRTYGIPDEGLPSKGEIEGLPQAIGEHLVRRKQPMPPLPPGKTNAVRPRWRPSYEEIVESILDLEEAVGELLALIGQIEEDMAELFERVTELEAEGKLRVITA